MPVPAPVVALSTPPSPTRSTAVAVVAHILKPPPRVMSAGRGAEAEGADDHADRHGVASTKATATLITAEPQNRLPVLHSFT
eukprot:scaffold3639_cov141-Isochrysis_galbana.AAC.16